MLLAPFASVAATTNEVVPAEDDGPRVPVQSPLPVCVMGLVPRRPSDSVYTIDTAVTVPGSLTLADTFDVSGLHGAA